MSTVREARDAGAVRLAAAGIMEAQTDARLLLEEALHTSYAGLLARLSEEISPEEARVYEEMLSQREQRIPLQHITGEAPFLGLSFIVTPDVLIPRADTEVLAEEALRVCAGTDVLDLCTGSGCLGVSLAVRGGCKSVTAGDISEEALVIARKNAMRLGAEITFVKSDLFEKIPGRFDLIVSNPPYIESDVIETLSPEVRDHDPRLALDGGADGLCFYRRICREAPEHLRPGGRLMVEIGADQAEAVRELYERAGFAEIRVIRDLAGLDRVITGKYHV